MFTAARIPTRCRSRVLERHRSWQYSEVSFPRLTTISGFSMWKELRSSLLIVCMTACVEPYEFVVRDNFPSLVVEAFIADKSYSETLSYPSDGRYFSVKLSRTGDVTNLRPVPVTGATVEVLSSSGG